MSIWLKVGGDDTWIYWGDVGCGSTEGQVVPSGCGMTVVGGMVSTFCGAPRTGCAGGVAGGAVGVTKGSQGSTQVVTLTSTSVQ